MHVNFLTLCPRRRSQKKSEKSCEESYRCTKACFANRYTAIVLLPSCVPFVLWRYLWLLYFAGLVVIAFGPSYSYSLIRLLYGRKWSDGEASTALQYFCLYVIVIAMNGKWLYFLLFQYIPHLSYESWHYIILFFLFWGHCVLCCCSLIIFRQQNWFCSFWKNNTNSF